MPDLYTPSKKTIGELLSGPTELALPRYQRDYSWTANEYEAFWNDLVTFSSRYPGNNVQDQEYFVGSIVLVVEEGRYLILDGQQRLTTASIIVSAIRDAISVTNPQAAADLARDYLRWVDPFNQLSFRYRLTLSLADRDFFQQEILEPPPAPRPQPTLASHQRIRKARRFFDTKLLELLTRPNVSHDESVRMAFRLGEVLMKHFSLVAITSRDEDSAAEVFETLNDRGLSLSTADLIQNLVLRKTSDAQRDETKRVWGAMKDTLGTVKPETFIRHAWVSRRGDPKSKSLFRTIKEAFENEGIDGLAFTRELRAEAAIYRSVLKHEHTDHDLRALHREVQILGAKALLPALLAASTLPLEEQKGAVSALVTLFVRHTLICGRENDLLENAAYRAAKEIRTTGAGSSAIEIIRTLCPTDIDFASAFARSSLKNKKQQRLILSRLELNLRDSNELAISDTITVEHIYPQRPGFARWQQHDEFVSRIGNLTLLSRRLNSGARNAEFTIKKPYYERSQILLTQALRQYDMWNTDTLDHRQQELSSRAVRVWPMP